MNTYKVRLDEAGKQMVQIIIGSVEVSQVGDFFRLIAAAAPCQQIMLPRRYSELDEACEDRDLLNCEEHPVSFSARFRRRQHTILSTPGVLHDL